MYNTHHTAGSDAFPVSLRSRSISLYACDITKTLKHRTSYNCNIFSLFIYHVHSVLCVCLNTRRGHQILKIRMRTSVMELVFIIITGA